MASILIVEDEVSMRRILAVLLAQDGHETAEAEGCRQAARLLSGHTYDLVITDQKLRDGTGMQVLESCRESDPTTPVILLTAYATIGLAVEAMRLGAFDFISKPFQPDTVLAAVRRACEHGRLLRENASLRDAVHRIEFGQNTLLGNSPAMREVRDLVSRAAPTDATVLITGETGTGKELVARAIHRNSRRADKPFIAVNCAAMPEPLLESQLFGHEKGAFTGADRARQGLFEAANGGTLFLDETGDMPLSLQAKLLRVLMDGEVTRIGANTPRKVNVRIVAATNRDLKARIAAGLFREDLYYRMAVVPIAIPPLRTHPEDIPVLAEHFLELVASDLKVPKRTLCDNALQKLTQYDLPGNVRELRNLIERAYILGKGREITENDLPVALRGEAANPADAVCSGPFCWLDLKRDNMDLRQTLEHVESRLLLHTLRVTQGNQAEAARCLGISRSDMSYKINKYQLRAQLPSMLS